MPSGGHTHGDYAKQMDMLRREKDHYFREAPDSPIPFELRASFTGLSYYPPDPRFRVRAKFRRIPDPEPVVLATSKGVPRDMVRYGTFEFEVDGVRQRLTAYKSVGHHHGPESLFVPFRDATSGKETYGAARYLDLDEPSGEDATIDFNLAYSPYCAYNDDYVCPFPPRENWLTIPIRAGEKNLPLKA